MSEVKEFGKIGRLNRDITITEKIDGTCHAVIIEPIMVSLAGPGGGSEDFPTGEFHITAQSKTKLLTDANDPYQFRAWVEEHAKVLINTLGVGIHFGEWWGKKIQRAYDMKSRVFSLFNIERWEDNNEGRAALACARGVGVDIRTVPVLYRGPWTGLLGYKVNDEAREDHGQWMNLAAQTDWSDVDFAREVEAQIELLYERIQVLTQMDLRDAVNIRTAMVNPRPRYAPNFILEHLRRTGSQAAPGYMRPEGIVVYHKASDTLLKAYVDPKKDAVHKGEVQ
jgi:hypothetical protein